VAVLSGRFLAERELLWRSGETSLEAS